MLGVMVGAELTKGKACTHHCPPCVVVITRCPAAGFLHISPAHPCTKRDQRR